jgi:hypothetical protein
MPLPTTLFFLILYFDTLIDISIITTADSLHKPVNHVLPELKHARVPQAR